MVKQDVLKVENAYSKIDVLKIKDTLFSRLQIISIKLLSNLNHIDYLISNKITI